MSTREARRRRVAPSGERIAPARRAAFEVLRRVFEEGAWADRSLPAALRRHRVSGRDRALAQRLAYGAVQRRGTCDHLAARLAERDPADLDPPLLAALRLGLYELLFADAIPDHAAVDQAVELAKGARAGPGRGVVGPRAAGLVNAVLRRAARERDALLAGLADDDPAAAAIAHSVPEWIARLWWEELGADPARALLVAANRPPERALRVNPLRVDPERLRAELTTAGVELRAGGALAPPAPPEAVVADIPRGRRSTDEQPPRSGVTADAGERERRPGALLAARIDAGELVPQSRASIAAAAALDPRPGERILDLCAGPGVKTTQLAGRMENRGELVAVEASAGRCSELRETCDRLGATCVRITHADAAEADLGDGYDRVLVDPPCSGLGTLASRPDARWRKSPGGVARMAELQRRIVAAAARAVRPGGAIVYATCTISRRENEEVVGAALAESEGLEAEDLGAVEPTLAAAGDRRFLLTRPDRDRTDGFFIARLRRGS